MERYNGKKKPRQQADKKTSRSVQTGRMTEEERQRERRRRRRALQRKRERQRRLILGIMAIGILFVTAAAVRGIAGRLLSSSDSSDKKTAVNASDASISVKDSQTTEKASSEAFCKRTRSKRRNEKQHSMITMVRWSFLRKMPHTAATLICRMQSANMKKPKLPVNHGRWKK